MKPLPILILLLLISCSGNKTGKNAISQTKNNIPVDETDTFEVHKPLNKSEIAAQLHGYWIGKDYLEKIEKTKSVYKNRDYTNKLWGFILDSTYLVGDSAYINGFTDHEGGYNAFLLFNPIQGKFENNSKRNKENPAFTDLDFSLEPEGDTLAILYKQTKRKEFYRRVKDDQYELRRILLEGSFISKNKEKISFSRNGKIEGLKGFNYFEVAYDFTEGIEFDAIYCYSSEARPEYYPQVYKFKFINNELLLYEVQSNWETLERRVNTKPIFLKRL